jgi:hypothetical protein
MDIRTGCPVRFSAAKALTRNTAGDPLLALMVSLRISVSVDVMIDQLIADWPPDELERWESEVRKTGRALPDLIQELIFKRDLEPQGGWDADWWKSKV